MRRIQSIKIVLICFILISTVGMGFTGHNDKNINYKDIAGQISSQDIKVDGPEQVVGLNTILENRVGMKLTAYTFMAGDHKIGTIRESSQIEEIIKELKLEFSTSENSNIDVKTVEILEDLDIIKDEVLLEDMDSKEEMLNYIKIGGQELKEHIIEVGESFATIAAIYNMKIEDLAFLNPGKDGQGLKIGDKVIIKIQKPLITVVTTQEVASLKNINFVTEVKEDPNMPDTKSEVKIEGQLGEEKTITKQIKYNDKVVKNEILKQEIIKAPVNKVIIKGTKKLPKTAASGTFLMPTRGRISSPFGSRWGRMHQGIDIAKAQGADISAADGGTVIASGVQGAYGKLIIIDHGNGFKTKYAHCSSLLVGVGTKVYKGQIIAKVGSTGRSTGPHLHFEIIKNGVNLNPSSFVK